jgi:seryl-tRNA synthetase
MLDLQLLRDDPERVKEAIRRKNAGDPAVVDRLLEADRERRAALTALQTLQQQQGELTRQIGPLMKAGRKDEAAPLLQQSNQYKVEIQDLQEAARQHEEAVNVLLLEIPNVPHESVPVGRTAEDNAIPFTWGEKPSFDFEPKPHWDLAAQHGLIDFERGAKVTGAGFPFYLGQGARFQRALIQFFLDRAVEAGYTEVQPPLMVNEASGIGTGQLPDKEGQMYGTEKVDLKQINLALEQISRLRNQLSREEVTAPWLSLGSDSGESAQQWQERNDELRASAEEADHHLRHLLASGSLYLVPTAEVPVTNYLRDETLEAGWLPMMYTAYTPCFRREAGSYGKDVRGLNRLHQFDKVEIVRFVHPDESYDHLEAMREHVESLLQALGLPYRRVVLCTGDMGFTQTKTYDLEVWSGAQERWLEVSSVSNFEAFQARRANIRFRPEGGGKPQFVHTLNGSALALPRIVAALLENGQQADGRIVLPKALHRYAGFEQIGATA